MTVQVMASKLLPVSVCLVIGALPAQAAIGCDLNFPASDVARLFPGSTGYKLVYHSLGPEALSRVEARLGERYRALYAPLNVPYTLYEVYAGTTKIGYIHGVNQKGQFGVIQVFLSLDLEGRIRCFYIQKITGPQAGKFRSAPFANQFTGITLRSFDAYDPATGKGSGRIARLTPPAPEAETDFYGVLRALKKNLVLMDEFVYSSQRGRS